MNLIKTAISRPVTVSMFVVAVILFGVVSLDRLALNLLPDISYPSLTIQTCDELWFGYIVQLFPAYINIAGTCQLKQRTGEQEIVILGHAVFHNE